MHKLTPEFMAERARQQRIIADQFAEMNTWPKPVRSEAHKAAVAAHRLKLENQRKPK